MCVELIKEEMNSSDKAAGWFRVSCPLPATGYLLIKQIGTNTLGGI